MKTLEQTLIEYLKQTWYDIQVVNDKGSPQHKQWIVLGIRETGPFVLPEEMAVEIGAGQYRIDALVNAAKWNRLFIGERSEPL